MAETKAFSIKLDEGTHGELGKLLDAIAERDDMSKGEALASMLPAMERAAAVDKAPALGQHLAAIDQAQAVVASQINAIANLYASVETTEAAKAQATIDAMAQTVADLRAQIAVVQEQLDGAVKTIQEGVQEVDRLNAALDVSNAEKQALSGELAAERAKSDVLASIAAKVDALTSH